MDSGLGSHATITQNGPELNVICIIRIKKTFLFFGRPFKTRKVLGHNSAIKSKSGPSFVARL